MASKGQGKLVPILNRYGLDRLHDQVSQFSSGAFTHLVVADGEANQCPRRGGQERVGDGQGVDSFHLIMSTNQERMIKQDAADRGSGL